MKGADVISAIGLSGLADMAKLSKWVEDSHLDPNDPANADIMHLMRVSVFAWSSIPVVFFVINEYTVLIIILKRLESTG